MAHGTDKKYQVRDSYVNGLLSLTAAAACVDVAEGTVRRWKAEAAKQGDDWDLARTAARRAKGPVGEFTTDFVEEFSLQVAATFELLKSKGDDLPLDQRTKILSSLTDMMSKVMKVSGGNANIARRTVAAEVIKKLAEFVSTRFPDFAPQFVVILQAFAPVIDREMSEHG